MEYHFTIPYLPPKELSPNARCHWSQKYKAARQLKNDAYLLAKQVKLPRFKRALIFYTFVVPDSRNRDPDNYLIMGKPIADALVAAGVLEDDRFPIVKYAPVVFKVERKGNPRTIIEISEVSKDPI